MIPEYLASGEVPHPFAQSHSSDLVVSGIGQQSFICNATADLALLLIGGSRETLS